MPLGGAKDEHFSCFHSSCQLGLIVICNVMAGRAEIKAWSKDLVMGALGQIFDRAIKPFWYRFSYTQRLDYSWKMTLIYVPLIQSAGSFIVGKFCPEFTSWYIKRSYVFFLQTWPRILCTLFLFMAKFKVVQTWLHFCFRNEYSRNRSAKGQKYKQPSLKSKNLLA